MTNILVAQVMSNKTLKTEFIINNNKSFIALKYFNK
jgi:hypothetical protein